MTTQRDEFIKKTKQQLDDINKQITAFEKKAEESGEKARADFDANIDKLRKQGKQMQAKLDELREAGEDSWDRMIEETRKVRDAFIHSFKYFQSQIR